MNHTIEQNVIDKSAQIAELCLANSIKISTAESCTGGLIAASLTELSGSSAWFERGFVTYSNEAKMQLLGVKAETLLQFGAVSEETAQEMALGCLQHSRADISVSVSGIAGPTGATPGKPVGTVMFAVANQQLEPVTTSFHQLFSDDRRLVRLKSVDFALKILINSINSQ